MRSFTSCAAAFRHTRRMVLGALLALAAVAWEPAGAAAQGFGDLIVSPTRIQLEGRDHSATVTLANRGAQTALFRISLVTMMMDANGNLKAVDKPAPGQLTAESLIRYAPRQVNIPPGGTQTVRLIVRKPKDLPAGEYRSHMFFRAVPPEDAGHTLADKGDGKSVRITLTPIFGITIPVIVRNGTLDVAVKIADLAVKPAKEKGKKEVTFQLQRSGTMSAYGDVQVQYTPSGGGKPVVVGEVTRLAVFTPNKVRNVVVPLKEPPGVTLGKGTLQVLYRQVNGETTLASGDIALE